MPLSYASLNPHFIGNFERYCKPRLSLHDAADLALPNLRLLGGLAERNDQEVILASASATLGAVGS
jgi:hypothetical protein